VNAKSAFTKIVVVAACLVAGSTAADDLFSSDQTLTMELATTMKLLVDKMRLNPTVSGVLTVTGDDGTKYVFNVRINTRNQTRLEHCHFPPLTISFRTEEIEGTPFEGHEKLKMDTLCKRDSTYETYLNQEYLIYRAYNLLSEASFRVRYLSVTYRDTEVKRRLETQPGYFIENSISVAKRNGMVRRRIARVRLDRYVPESLATYSLFMFMMGLMDWSVTDGPRGGTCCHNSAVIGPQKLRTKWLPVPYEFVQAGLIKAKYVEPHRVVRKGMQRRYRGFCATNDQLPATIDAFAAARQDIEALFAPGLLDEEASQRSIEWLGSFYAILANPEKVEEDILGRCTE